MVLDHKDMNLFVTYHAGKSVFIAHERSWFRISFYLFSANSLSPGAKVGLGGHPDLLC